MQQQEIKPNAFDMSVAQDLMKCATKYGLDLSGGKIRRSSSRFCLGVEHGDYNGTPLFGVGCDRYIWCAFKANGTDTVRMVSMTYPCPVSDNGVVKFKVGTVPEPGTKEHDKFKDSWARFPYGVDWVLRKKGYTLKSGFDCVIFSNIPGGGMSRSASLGINLVLTTMEVNGHEIPSGKDRYEIVELAQSVENDYIGSPCGNLDQVMILYARDGYGTHFVPSKGCSDKEPRGGTVTYIPLGGGTYFARTISLQQTHFTHTNTGLSAEDFRIVALDTGTDRPGLEKSTYAIRSRECKQFTKMLGSDDAITKMRSGSAVKFLSDIDTSELFDAVMKKYSTTHANLCDRLRYIYFANQRFKKLMRAWSMGDLATVGAVFREDGHGLRDEYDISGPELETMCNIVRTVPGCLGERMLGGGDKGAAGALAKAGSEDSIRSVVNLAYPRAYPALKSKYKVHVCKFAQGIAVFEGLLNSSNDDTKKQ